MNRDKHPSPCGEAIELHIDHWFVEKEGIGPHIRGRKVEETDKAICVDVAPKGRTDKIWIPKSVSREPEGTNSKLTQYANGGEKQDE